MKTKLCCLLPVVILLFSTSAFAGKSTKSTTGKTFFTTSDQANWVYILKDKSIKPTDVFKMDNGLLQITGVSSGYLRTSRKYSDYELFTEWRWTKTIGNSGVLIHIQQKDTIWPVCYQVQQKSGDAGDIICMNGLWAKECTDSVKFTVKKMTTSNEKPLGEWNIVDLYCFGQTSVHVVNGQVVVINTNCSKIENGQKVPLTKGKIQIQSEGGEFLIRKMEIEKIKGIPAELLDR